MPSLVCSTSDVALGAVAPFAVETADGTSVLIALVHDEDDSWYALEDRCSHGRQRLSDGEVWEGGLECVRHGSIFDLKTGCPRTLPATEPVHIFDVTVDGESVLVDVAN